MEALGLSIIFEMDEDILKDWNEEDHPRLPAGQGGGGQFTAGAGFGGGGQPKEPPPAHAEGGNVVSTGERNIRWTHLDGGERAILQRYNINQADMEKVLAVKNLRVEARAYSNANNRIDLNVQYYDHDDDHVAGFEFGIGRGANHDDIHIDLAIVNNAAQGKDMGSNFISRLESLAKKTGTIKSFSLLADISIGYYAWAKMGFDYQNKDDLETRKGRMVIYAKEFIKLSPRGYDEAFLNDLNGKISKLKSANDIANFKIPNMKFTAKALKDAGWFRNSDVADDVSMDLGKAFMLNRNSEGHGSWNAIKRLK